MTQVGFELGAGRVDEVSQDYSLYAHHQYDEVGRIGFDARYTQLGANVRVNLGQGSSSVGLVTCA